MDFQTKKRDKIYLLLIMLFTFVSRFFGLGKRSFDGDEGIIALISQSNWNEFFVRAGNDVHPPLFHIFVKLSMYFAINEWTLRLTSAIAGIVFIYLIYLFVKKIFNQNIALLASFLSAISSYLLYPAQEVRMYALFALFALGSYYFFIKLLDKINFSNSCGYIIFSISCLYTQYLGFVIIVGQLAYLIFFKKDFFKQFKSWFLVYISIIISFLPQLSTLLNQSKSRLVEQSQAISLGTNIKGLIGAIYRFSAGRLFLDLNPVSIKELIVNHPILGVIFLLSFIVPVVFFLIGLRSCYKNYKKNFWFIVVPIIIAIIISLISTNIGSHASRYLIYIYPFFICLIALGINAIWRTLTGKILVVILIVINIYSLYSYYSRDIVSPGANAIAQYISSNTKKGDAILLRGGFGGGEKWSLQYYLQKLSISDSQLPIFDMFESYTPGNLAQLKLVKPQDKIKEILNQYNRVLFYDMTYETSDIVNAKKNILGYDKEGKPLIIWEINK